MRRGMIVVTLVVAGCVTQTYTPETLYVLAPEIRVSAAQPSDGTLGIRPLQAARPYKQAIVFRSRGPWPTRFVKLAGSWTSGTPPT